VWNTSAPEYEAQKQDKRSDKPSDKPSDKLSDKTKKSRKARKENRSNGSQSTPNGKVLVFLDIETKHRQVVRMPLSSVDEKEVTIVCTDFAEKYDMKDYLDALIIQVQNSIASYRLSE
jgi:hypothetical protein